MVRQCAQVDQSGWLARDARCACTHAAYARAHSHSPPKYADEGARPGQRPVAGHQNEPILILVPRNEGRYENRWDVVRSECMPEAAIAARGARPSMMCDDGAQVRDPIGAVGWPQRHTYCPLVAPLSGTMYERDREGKTWGRGGGVSMPFVYRSSVDSHISRSSAVRP